MQTVTIETDQKNYNVQIGSNLIESLDHYVRQNLKGTKVVLISDKNVWHYHGETIRKSFADTPYTVHRLLIQPGEASKHISKIQSLYQALIRLEVTRNDLIVAFGGGVVGDLSGFIASTYLRGIPFIQVPTSLLAMVDSSVGGKVAVNLDEGKNLVGNFYHPEVVLIDPELLRTLSTREFSSGMAEVLKYGCIEDRNLFMSCVNLYQAQDIYKNVIPIIKRCCEIKGQLVKEDEKDKGSRMLLNFGHTLGHAIEKAMNYEGITHGEAVAIGMYQISLISEKMAWTADGTTNEIGKALNIIGLPTESSMDFEKRFLSTIRNDKKRSGDLLNLIILRELGKAEIKSLTMDQIESLFK